MNKSTRGVFCTLLGGILWGLSGVCGQYLFIHYNVPSGWLTVARMLGAGILLCIWCLALQRKQFLQIFHHKKDALQLILFAIAGLLFSQYAYLTAISYSNAATATVLQYLGPVLIMVLVCLRKKKLPTAAEAIAVFLAVLGTFLLATHGNPSTMVLSKQAFMWGILAAISLACYTLLPAKIIPRWGSITVTGYGMLIGGIVLAIATRVWQYQVKLDLPGYLALGGVVILGTLFAYTLYMQGVADIGGVKASMLACIEPVASTVISILWLHTRFAVIDLIGFVCILTTVRLIQPKNK